MEIIIRPFLESDCAAVTAVWRDVLDIRDATEESVRAVYAQMAPDDNYVTFVAEADGKTVGLVTAVKVLAVGHPGGYVKMNGLGVLPGYRRRGVGRMLMERVEKWAVERGAPYIGLASGAGRTDAHEFYEHLGYNRTSYWFRKRLK